MPLFEVAILRLPTKKEAEEGHGEKLVLGPKAVVAGAAETAGLVAVQGTDLDVTSPDRLQVLVRPFG